MRKLKFAAVFFIGVLLGLLTSQDQTGLWEQMAWRRSQLIADIKYFISPPERVVFVPEKETLSPQLTTTGPATPTSTATFLRATETAPALPTTFTATPLPVEISLTGLRHEYQAWNNCGPATLAMALSFWGWKGDQQPIAAFTKPNSRDKNVMPYELIDYVETEAEFQAIARMGGDIDLLKRLIASGFPVIIEKGFVLQKDGWMGHYELVTAYDDRDQRFTLQDSFLGPNQHMTYTELESNWRAFNFTYLIVYPAPRQQEIEVILGPRFDESNSYRAAADRASAEIYELEGMDNFFAWFNRGTSLAKLQDYAGAADAYDQAFTVYPQITEKDRPWRMMWYQTGPYWSYYYTGRYRDVIDLATKTLDMMSEPVLEESYYWRALAQLALGNRKAALKDLQASIQYHPDFEPALAQLDQLKKATP